MPRPFNEPSINTSVDIIKYANDVTGGWITILFVISSVIIFFLYLKTKLYKTSDSLLVSFLLTVIISSFLWAAGLLAGKIIVILVVLMIASGIYSILES